MNRNTSVLNSDLIEQIESTPDTVIHLVNGQKILVLESADEIVDRVVEFRRRLLRAREEPRLMVPDSGANGEGLA